MRPTINVTVMSMSAAVAGSNEAAVNYITLKLGFSRKLFM